VLRSDSYNRGIQTQKEYERILDRVITPFFEHFKFDDITALDLLEFFNSVAKQYSYDRAKRTKNILCNILETAHDEDLMKKNIVRARVVQKHQFKKTVKTTQAYKVSEVKEMLNKEGIFQCLPFFPKLIPTVYWNTPSFILTGLLITCPNLSSR